MTDYLKNVIEKYQGAWVMIALMTLTLLINIIMVVWFMFGNLKLVALRYGNRCMSYLKSKFQKKEKLPFYTVTRIDASEP